MSPVSRQEYQRAYYAAHREQILERHREYKRKYRAKKKDQVEGLFKALKTMREENKNLHATIVEQHATIVEQHDTIVEQRQKIGILTDRVSEIDPYDYTLEDGEDDPNDNV